MDPDDVEISGLYAPDADVKPLLVQLGEAGVPERAVAILSPLPLPANITQASSGLWPHAIAIVAGLGGIALGLGLAAGTAALYPLRTGGKPIIAWPVVGIISFETMMLFAIAATFVTALVRVRRVSGRIITREPRIADGLMAVSVRVRSDDPVLQAVRAIHHDAGAKEVRQFPLRQPVHSLTRNGAEVILLLLACLLCGGLSGCSRDMQDQVSYQPQETPRLHSPPDSVPRQSRSTVPSLLKRGGHNSVDGRRLYQINCLHCHGPDGRGNGPVAAYLKEPPADLFQDRVQEKSTEELYAILTRGKDAMPSFRGELSADERWTVAQYVQQLRLPTAAETAQEPIIRQK